MVLFYCVRVGICVCMCVICCLGDRINRGERLKGEDKGCVYIILVELDLIERLVRFDLLEFIFCVVVV